MVEKIPIFHYIDIIGMIVCDNRNADCMLRKCDNCPGVDTLRDDLLNSLELSEIDLDEKVSFSQWIQTERSNVQTVTTAMAELIEQTCEKN